MALAHGKTIAFGIILFAGVNLAQLPTSASSEEDCTDGLSNAEIEAWIADPMPTDFTGTSKCSYYQFAWQEFLGLTGSRNGGEYPFMSWIRSEELFTSDGAPPPWNGLDGSLKVRQINKHGATVPHQSLDSTQQAGSLVPIVDRFGELAYYSIHLNRIEYDVNRCCGFYTGDCFNASAPWPADPTTTLIDRPKEPALASTFRLPNGSAELKLAWRVLHPSEEADYIVVEGEIADYTGGPSRTASLGLVGMHILHKPYRADGGESDWIWTTFEHRNNAPTVDADTQTCAPESNHWSFFDRDCTDNCEQNAFYLPCPAALRQWDGQVSLQDESNPDQTIPEMAKSMAAANPPTAGLDADGNLIWTSAPDRFQYAKPGLYDPITCTANPTPTQVCREFAVSDPAKKLNGYMKAAIRDLLGPESKLSNYRMIGVTWRAKGSTAPSADKNLLNVTMETFEPIGCTVCHADQFNPMPWNTKPIAEGLNDYSFLFQRIRQTSTRDAPKCEVVAEEIAGCKAWLQNNKGWLSKNACPAASGR